MKEKPMVPYRIEVEYLADDKTFAVDGGFAFTSRKIYPDLQSLLDFLSRHDYRPMRSAEDMPTNIWQRPRKVSRFARRT